MANNVEYTLSLRDLLTGKLKEADAAAKGLEGSMSGIQNILGALGITAGIAGIVAFGKSVVEAGTKVEDARVGLTTLLKDANAAGEVIKNTMEDAAKTPFAFEGLLAANKALISAGADSQTARKDVLNLANAIAATGGGNVELERMVINLQQIKNTGKATALDIKQFAYAGVNLYAALDAAGISYAKGQELTYEQITMALQKAHEAGGIYYNGLENMAGNTSIKISNLGDAMFQLSVKIFDDLKPAIDAVVGALQGGIKFVSEHGKAIKALAFGVSVGAAAWGIYTIATNAAAVATGILNAIMALNPVYFIIAGIGALAATLFYAYEKIEWFRGGINGLWEVIKTVAPMIGNAMMGLGKIIMGVLIPSPSQIKEGWSQLTTAFQDAGSKIGTAWEKGYSQGTTGMAGAAGKTAAKGKAVIGAPPEKTSVSPKGATGTKAVTINISINKMIETFKINTTNLQESASKVHEAVSNTLLQAINDSQIVGNI